MDASVIDGNTTGIEHKHFSLSTFLILNQTIEKRGFKYLPILLVCVNVITHIKTYNNNIMDYDDIPLL